jgi:hypothetical protein
MSDQNERAFSPKRRDFLKAAGSAGAGLVLAGQTSQLGAPNLLVEEG